MRFSFHVVEKHNSAPYIKGSRASIRRPGSFDEKPKGKESLDAVPLNLSLG
jgi:hypothetical protein